MKISKLITWQWGSLEAREWPFADTVLLTGESGSGKSTLLDSIQTLLTAAHHHLVQFNIGQDESTQSRRGGKEPRTLAAYALGQQADGVFLRKRSTSYVALVFEASEGAGEEAQALTALIGVEAHEDAAKAVLSRSLFFIVRRALDLQQFLLRTADGMQPVPVPVKDLYLHLQHQLRVGPEVVQRFEDKSSYLTHLYGAMMGKTAVSEPEAFRAAKSIVKAMAYNVNDLVRDEILDAHDFSRDLDKMRELMRSMASLKAEAERLQQNIERLESVEAAATRVAETIENNVRSKILKEQLTDPAYFAKMSALLDEIIRLRKEKAIEYEDYLARIADVAKKVSAGKADDTPLQLKTAGQLALYNNLKDHVAANTAQEPAAPYAGMTVALDTALKLDAAIKAKRPDGWRGVVAKEQMVKQAMFDVLKDIKEVNRLYPIVFAQKEY
jgi:energy-coupling factor transporter ATP-binding protein EcfA2